MMKKEALCPVCNGKGVVYGIAEGGMYPSTPCHGCAEWGSRGWIVIPVEDTINLEYELTGRDLGKDWTDKCPACGGDRYAPVLAGCPKGEVSANCGEK